MRIGHHTLSSLLGKIPSGKCRDEGQCSGLCDADEIGLALSGETVPRLT